MRIISGKYRGRKLLDCKQFKDLRPTTDSNRESLFNLLNSSKNITKTGFDLSQAVLLDVFCGTGAVSLEALSRGAKFATIIDKNFKHLEIAKSNAKLLGESQIEFVNTDLLSPIFKSKKPHNLIYIDPPYALNVANQVLQNLITNNWIEKGALIIVEHAANLDLNLSENCQPLENRRYGKTSFSFFRYL